MKIYGVTFEEESENGSVYLVPTDFFVSKEKAINYAEHHPYYTYGKAFVTEDWGPVEAVKNGYDDSYFSEEEKELIQNSLIVLEIDVNE